MGIDKKTLAVSKTYTNKVALGFQSVTQTATGFTITFKDGSTATYNVQNMHEHANKNILDLLSVDLNGNLLYNGKSISPDFIDTTGDGSKFLANDGTYKTVTTGGVAYDDTQVKADIQANANNIATNTSNISDLTTKIGNITMGTTATTITGAVKEINGNQLDTVSFSSDYKNIVLNRKNGLNPYSIPISAIINHAKLVELADVDATDIGNEKALVYDGTTKKHKYVESKGTDELVKMDNTTSAHYLADLLDKQTVVNDNGVLKVKKLDGQQVTITEINYLKGLTMNVMDLVNSFANGGVKVLNTPVATHADLATLDRSKFIDGISYIVYVLADETHAGAKTTYLCDKTSETYFGNADSQRNFTTNPINLANEVTGKLGTSHIDVDSLWSLLTIDDTYKTLTTTDNVFGTHGAKKLYDELTTEISKKANANDLTKHTKDTNIHVTTVDKTKWDKVTDKVNITDFNTHKNDTDIHITSAERTKWNGKEDSSNKTTTIDSTSTDTKYPSAKAVYDNAIKNNNIKTYCLLSQLGITTTPCTIKDIWDKMPVNSIAIIDTDSTIVTDVDYFKIPLNIPNNQQVYGFLTIGKFMERTILEFRRSHALTPVSPETFIGYCVGKDCTSIQWKKVYITGVPDVGRTAITFTDETNYKNFDINNNFSFYYVQNGICYMSIYITCVSPYTNTSAIKTFTSTIPKPKYYVRKQVSAWEITNSNSNCLEFCINDTSAFIFGGTVGKSYLLQFSYPVAES